MSRIGDGDKSISSAFDISRNTVRRYVRMYQDSGIPAEKLPSLSDARLGDEQSALPTRSRTIFSLRLYIRGPRTTTGGVSLTFFSPDTRRKIAEWRYEQALERTRRLRPDLLDK